MYLLFMLHRIKKTMHYVISTTCSLYRHVYIKVNVRDNISELLKFRVNSSISMSRITMSNGFIYLMFII
jgi:hypothetical protein